MNRLTPWPWHRPARKPDRSGDLPARHGPPAVPQRSPILPLLLLAALGCALPAGAQTSGEAASGEPSDTVFETIQVAIVNLEVFVSDRHGNPVTGLTRDDFELFVDGRSVPISNFYAAAPEPGPAGRPAAPPPGTAPASEEPQRPGEELTVVFYVDDANLHPVNRNRVLTALERFVARDLPAGARTMLVTYDHSLHVRQPSTRDRAALLDAVGEVRGLSGLAPAVDARRRQALDEIEKASSAGEAMLAVDSFADERQVELTRPLEALADLMEPLGGLPGRKMVVHVSDGLPNHIAEELYYLVDARFPRSGARLRSFLYDMTSSYQRIFQAANAAGVTLYALDATGLTPFESLSAAEPGSSFGGSFDVADSIRKSNLQVPLETLAEETGGVAVTNSNDLEDFFGRLATDAGAYYSLGYQAPPEGEGRYRTVRVEVDRPGARVRHRRGLRVRSLESRLREGVLAALTLGRAGGRFPGPVSVGRPTPQSGGLYKVPLDVQIPLDKVTLVPGKTEWVGRLRLAVQARDDQGNLSNATVGEPLDIRIPAAQVETARRQHVTWTVDLLMEPGPHELAIGLADLVADQMEFSVGRVEVETGAVSRLRPLRRSSPGVSAPGTRGSRSSPAPAGSLVRPAGG